MSSDILTLGRQHLRGTDGNSLLRLYDQAKEILNTSPSQQERTRADQVLRRLAKELKRRNIAL